MKMPIYHKPSPRERHIVAPNYTYGFTRWLKRTTGRTLCPPHRHIIDRLERARHTAAPASGTPQPWRHRPSTPARIIISDPAPGQTYIANLLVHYIHWLRTVILPHRRTLILDRTATAARALVNTLLTSPATLPTRFHTVGSGLRPTTRRGATFDIILLLNADTYPTDTLDAALDTVIPMLQPHRENILIIHGTPYPRPPRRNTTRRRTPSRHPSLTPSLNSLSSSTPPLRPTPFLQYLTASLDGDLGPFILIDPESPPRHSQRGSPRHPSDAPCDRPSGHKLSRRDSDNERTPCLSSGTASTSAISPGGTFHSDNPERMMTPPYIPLTFAAAAPAA
ncbi:MAG: hypothetical protein NC117_07325 [Pseudoflavonifractor sp.]|nr:hypothetical protein [Pseudoflavonifractor sp.]